MGILCVGNRLWDFRKTTRIAKDRGQWARDGMPDEEINTTLKQRREAVEKLGKRTWVLFHLQLGSFAFGLLALVLVFISMYRTKLF